MQTTSAPLRLADYVVKQANFPAGAQAFANQDEAAAWKDIPIGRVLVSRHTLENGIYGNRVNPVNCPSKSFFIPDDYFTDDYFRRTNSNRNPQFTQSDVRR